MLAVLIGLVALMLWCAHPGGRTVRRWMVEAPASWLNRVGGGRLVLIGLSLAAIVAAAHLLEAEGAMALGYTLGEVFAWFVAFDIATWVEVYAVIWLLGARRVIAEAVRQVRSAVGDVARRVLRLATARTPRIRRPPRRPGSRSADDEPAAWPTLLAA